MCTDLGPDIQNNEHATIVPALTEVMKDFNEPRVQAHAAAAIVNFSENCDEVILTGYLDALITQLLGLLQNGQKLVKVGSRKQYWYPQVKPSHFVFMLSGIPFMSCQGYLAGMRQKLCVVLSFLGENILYCNARTSWAAQATLPAGKKLCVDSFPLWR